MGLLISSYFFLPPNVTSVQPCDMGIIRKAMYCKNIVSRIVSEIDTGSIYHHLMQCIIIMLKGSWKSVKKTTVVNCFAKAGFVVSPDEEEEVED